MFRYSQLFFSFTALLIATAARPTSALAGFATDKNSKGFGNNKNDNNKKKKNQKPQQAKLDTVLLGRDKSVQVWIPPNELEGNQQETSTFTKKKNKEKLLKAYAEFRGTGDVLWPSSLHLARLIANCPSFVAGKRVLDLGCGLGLASLAALLGEPQSLTICDIDEKVLDWAWKSCEQTQNNITPTTSTSTNVSKLKLDWASPNTWPERGSIDLVMASDVLYDEDATMHINKLIAHLLGDEHHVATNPEEPTGRALIVDPINRPNRDAFAKQALEAGLTAEMAPFPGQEEEFVLINVVPRSIF